MRKWFLAIWAAIVSVFALFNVNIKLVANVNEVSLWAGILVIGVWIFTEFKKDWADFKENLIQTNKWADPAFWTAAISGVVLPILGLLNVQIPTEYISAAAVILSIIVPIFVRKTRQTVSISQR